MARNAILIGLADRAGWSTLSAALAAAGTGQAQPLLALLGPYLAGTSPLPPRLDARLVTTCNDQRERPPAQQITGLARDWEGRYPLFGGLAAQSLVWCSPWPVPSAELPKPGRSAIPPVLVLSTAADPVTPQQGTERTARELTSGVLVGWQGGGHGAVPESACATSAARRFLTDGVLPKDGTVCPA